MTEYYINNSFNNDTAFHWAAHVNLLEVLVLFFKFFPRSDHAKTKHLHKIAYNILPCGVLAVMGRGRDKSSDNTQPDTSRQNPPYHSELLK